MRPFLDPTHDHLASDDWLSPTEGQLLVDVLETRSEVIVRSAIAGVASEDLDISLSEDTLTIRGTRTQEKDDVRHTILHAQECHWGAFSRSIILPSHVDADSVQATLKKGVLTIRLRKIDMDRSIPVLTLDDE